MTRGRWIWLGALLAGCVAAQTVTAPPRLPGTVQAGRQAWYRRPAPAEAALPPEAVTPEEAAHRASRQQVLGWLVLGMALLGAGAFVTEQASRRRALRERQREE